DQDCRSNFFFHEWAERLEGESFILAPGDEDDRFVLREQCFFDRVEVRGLRVVDVIDAGDLPDELATMRSWFVSAERRDHLFEREAAGHAGSERGHQVFNVV